MNYVRSSLFLDEATYCFAIYVDIYLNNHFKRVKWKHNGSTATFFLFVFQVFGCRESFTFLKKLFLGPTEKKGPKIMQNRATVFSPTLASRILSALLHLMLSLGLRWLPVRSTQPVNQSFVTPTTCLSIQPGPYSCFFLPSAPVKPVFAALKGFAAHDCWLWTKPLKSKLHWLH